MLISFTKMHAQGNDFIILDAFNYPPNSLSKIDLPALAAKMCQRRTDVGADGLVTLSPAKTADGQMQIFNSDGSRAEMCGSALRCVAFLLRSKRRRGDLSILTDSGLKTALVNGNNQVSVNLGVPKILQKDLIVEDFCGDLVDIGNLHFIVWHADLESDPHLKHGSFLENNPAFPKPVNVHFVRLGEADTLQMKIWERAVGATQACGTGAVSSVCSAVSRGLDSEKVLVQMPGGEVIVKPGTHGYQLTGEVFTAYRGEYDWRI